MELLTLEDWNTDVLIFDSNRVKSLEEKFTPYYTLVNNKQLELSTIYTVYQYDSYFTVIYKQKTKIVKYYINEGKIYISCSCNFLQFSMIICRYIYAVVRYTTRNIDHLRNKIFSLYNWYKIILKSYFYVNRPTFGINYINYTQPPTKSRSGTLRTKITYQ